MVDVPKLKCLRCGHEWVPRSSKEPEVCPNNKCKSPYWHTPRKSEKVEGEKND